MGPDFPAAHSMDSAWFAVDRDGHVAFFRTGEMGLLPRGVPHQEWIPAPLEALLQATFPAGAAGSLGGLVKFGVFVYYPPDESVPGPYDRTDVPDRPLHIDELPESVRRAVAGVELTSVCFAQAARVFPMDDVVCDGYAPGYLSSDGKTVLPVPGREAEYARYFRDYLTAVPELAREYVFPGLPNEGGERERDR